jgi:hypothetical protein
MKAEKTARFFSTLSQRGPIKKRQTGANGKNRRKIMTNRNHPGCNELHGDDDAAKTYPEMTRGGAFREVMRQTNLETRPAMKLALLDLAEAITRGGGGREAFRRVRQASIHS